VPSGRVGTPALPAPTPEQKLAGDELLSYKAAAATYNLSRRTLERAVRAKEIDSFLIGKRCRRLLKSSLVAWLARHYEQSNQQGRATA
jgi:excisionase family DNA binding protein